MWPFYYFSSQRDYDILKSKSPYVLLYKNYTFSKNETEPKMENPRTFFERQTSKNSELKVKLWWVGSRERKKSAFCEKFILSERHFYNICVLSRCILYWINFQNIHTFTYQKTLLYTHFCLFLKSYGVYVSIWETFYFSNLALQKIPQIICSLWFFWKN